MNIKDKIEKLLRLSESPNENEAKAALLKARKLMMEHKLSEADFKVLEKQEPVKIETGIYFTKKTNYWITQLLTVIAPNYACNNYMNKKYRKKSHQAIIYGFKEDAELCERVFKYAVDCVMSWIKELKKSMRGQTAYIINSYADSYAQGFIDGLKESYDEQTEENEQEWGLVAVVPPEVKAVTDDMKPVYPNNGTFFASEYYSNGFIDGRRFSMEKRLESEGTV